ncbi:MAG: LacI family transcriptional regulator [Sphaerochaetaceae bacterium]|nr:LacI family transcriptional regulator [Sphaerochaetaceae bacterium]
MSRYATLSDVAKLANTSIATVSYVLNGGEGRYITEELRDRVLKAAKELHYVKSHTASALKRAHSKKTIAILIPQPQNQFFMDILIACSNTLSKCKYETIIGFTMDDPETERSLIQQMLENRVDGIIISPTDKAKESLELVQNLNIPFVVLSRPMTVTGLEKANSVQIQNYTCGFKGAECLVSHNHTHIGFVGWNSTTADGSSRIRACLDVYDHYGIPKENFHVVKGEFSSDAGYDATKKLMEEYPDTTGIFFGYHVLALGGLRYLKEQNLRVPEDISVVIYGHPQWVTAGENDYTYIEMYPTQMGEQAAQLLVKLVEEENNNVPATHLTIEGSLHIGKSVKLIEKK